LLNDRVIPFFDEHGLRIDRVLTDGGTEYCGAVLAGEETVFDDVAAARSTQAAA
jgi:hypothetical protein